MFCGMTSRTDLCMKAIGMHVQIRHGCILYSRESSDIDNSSVMKIWNEIMEI